jgi:cytosine/adenosine deaminase-related metal-dependent hydrolase
MRMTLTRGAINLSFADGGIADERLMQSYDAVLADCERVLARYHDASDGSFLRVALAPCAPFNVTRKLMIDTAALAENTIACFTPIWAKPATKMITACITSAACRWITWNKWAG